MRLGRASCQLCFGVSWLRFLLPEEKRDYLPNSLIYTYPTYKRGGNIVTHCTVTPTGESLILLISSIAISWQCSGGLGMVCCEAAQEQHAAIQELDLFFFFFVVEELHDILQLSLGARLV